VKTTCRRIEREPLTDNELGWKPTEYHGGIAFFARFNGFLALIVHVSGSRWQHGVLTPGGGFEIEGVSDFRGAKRSVLSRCFRAKPSEAPHPSTMGTQIDSLVNPDGDVRIIFASTLGSLDEDQQGPILNLAAFSPQIRVTPAGKHPPGGPVLR
jgi:hypothetical protein